MRGRGGKSRKSSVLAASIAFLLLLPAGATAATTQTLPLDGATGAGPNGIALDSEGNVYSANTGPNTITKILASGNLSGGSPTWISLSTGGGPGLSGGTQNILFDSAGNLFVLGGTKVGKYLPAGTPAGSPWPAILGSNPESMTIDPAGNLYVADLVDDIVSKITPGGQVPAGWPVTVGPDPDAIALDSAGNVYTASFGDGVGPGTVSRITPSGAVDPSFGSSGVQPSGITTDPDRNIYTANCGSGSAGSISRITAAGTSQTAWSSLGANTCPRAITIDSAGNLYTANNVGDSISRVTPAGEVTKLADTSDQPLAITIDSQGNLYTANYGTNNVTKVTPAPGDGVAPAPPDIPAAPSAVAGSGSATVTVTANAVSARFGAPSSYTVEAVQDPTKSCTVSPPATSCAVTGLTGGSSYTFTARSNLNAWETGASSPSNAVTPTAPDPGPDPNPDPNPDPTPTPSISVTSLKAKVQKQSVSFSSKATVSGAGTISQKAKQGKKVWCTTSKTVSGAGTYGLTCNLGKKGRSALRKKALKLSVTTTFKPGTGSPVSKPSTITIKRKR